MLEGYYRRLVDEIREFMRLESAAGILLLVAAMLALIANNGPLARYYDLLLSLPLGIHLGTLAVDKPVGQRISDMTLLRTGEKIDAGKKYAVSACRPNSHNTAASIPPRTASHHRILALGTTR